MNNIPQEIKDKIQDLVKSESLIEALNIIENYDADFNQIVLLKGQVNMLKRDKGLFSSIDYHIQLQKLKKSICGTIDLKYQPEEILLQSPKKTIYKNEFIETENRIRNWIVALENRIQNPLVILLRRRFERLVKEKNNGAFENGELKIFFNQIEFSCKNLATEFAVDLNNVNQNQSLNNNQLTLEEELKILISQNQNNPIKLNQLLILQTKYNDLEKIKRLGCIDHEKYFKEMNKINNELEFKIKIGN